MNSFFLFDTYESLMMNCNEFSKNLEKLKESMNGEYSESINRLQIFFEKITKQSEVLFDYLINANVYECAKTEKLCKKLIKSKTRANKYLTLQKELSSRQSKIKSKNRSLTSSLKKLRKIWKNEVYELESSLKKQQKTHNKLSCEYNSSLEAIEKEITTALELPILNNKDISMNTSCEFDCLMREINIGNEIGIDNSRFSMEKNAGG